MSTDISSSVALGALALYAVVAFVGRSVLQWHRTGSTGWRGLHGRPGSASWWAGVLVAIGGLGLVIAPVGALLLPAAPVGHVRMGLGGMLFLIGFAITVIAQLAMGDAWRIGVRDGERTELRTHGPFAWCRNPIFTGMLVAALGLVAWIPLAAPAWLALWLGLELQVRVVEEPHLSKIHGSRYLAYATRTGRFLPWLGQGLGPIH
ncbi:methyltransferase family protein [Paraliomyxa miuraensis]|uniref:methyltransferase family protein n=1 Tax=Paraliomyxa miuraensis TaxID=376150 RepID=UPI0022540FD0|nr:isoprenylcysteine carboxylmethyltransferase family protein [Paraliomyxa miuraensis]MCX4240352.1 isoprenylcysteine carboxylmethyltransferase family protein [Paraliomyxa miuraensis]